MIPMRPARASVTRRLLARLTGRARPRDVCYVAPFGTEPVPGPDSEDLIVEWLAIRTGELDGDAWAAAAEAFAGGRRG
jgi:hypothetical protein